MTGIKVLSAAVIFFSRLCSASDENNAVHPEFEAVLGSTALLPCEVPPRPASSGIKCIFWYKDDEVMSMYTVDARDESHSLHVPSDRLRARARFDPSPWPPLLSLVDVKETDAGVYYCRVDYRWDRTYMHTVVLKVIVPPQKLSILNEHEEEVVRIAGPYLEGQSVRLICEAIGGKPSPYLSWWRDQEPLNGGHSIAAHGQVRSDYIFVPSRLDLLTTLTCRSVNNNITAPNKVSVQVDLYLKPVNVQLTPQRVSFTATRNMELRCYSSGSRPPARMSWFLDNEVLSNHTDLLSIDGNRTTSILSFWPSRSDHGKYLRCRTENFLLSDSALEDGWKLNVTYVPQVTLTLRSSSKQAQYSSTFLEGDDVRFSCEVRSNPSASQIGWRFDGRPLPLDDPELVVSFKSLLVKRVNRMHRGRYQCYANNAEGTGVSRVIHLRAMYAPVCSQGLQTTYVVPAGEMAQVGCQVEADPPAVQFSWEFSNTQERYYNVSHISAGQRSVASFTPRTAKDYGTLYCWGKNIAGEQHMPCIFTVIPVGPPEILESCSSTNVTMTSVAVVCTVRTRQAENQTDLRYYLEMFLYGSHEMKLQVNSDQPSFLVRNLTAETDLLFAVYAANGNGKSVPQIIRVTTLRSPTEGRVYREERIRNTIRGHDPWSGPALLLVAASCCFLLFAGAALCTGFKGGQKCKELPMHFKKSFSNGTKCNKNYIDRMPEGYEKRTPCI